jgi:hypothetical protein
MATSGRSSSAKYSAPTASASVGPPRLPSDDALAPFRKEVADSGMTDDELLNFFEGVREEVYQQKHGRPGKAP